MVWNCVRKGTRIRFSFQGETTTWDAGSRLKSNRTKHQRKSSITWKRPLTVQTYVPSWIEGRLWSFCMLNAPKAPFGNLFPFRWAPPICSRSPQTIFPELEECIRSEYHEVRLAALLTLVEIFHYAKKAAEKTGMLQKQCIDFYLAHTAYINNWDLVDLSCYPLLGEWLLDKDRTLLYDLARNGKTLWEQRIGIVSTMTFIRHGQLEDTFALADILLHHPHDLIHKAVGWLLREAGKRDKAALEAYLKGAPAEAVGAAEDGAPAEAGAAVRQPATSRYRTMPRTMLRYAIERFPEAERQAYLAK